MNCRLKALDGKGVAGMISLKNQDTPGCIFEMLLTSITCSGSTGAKKLGQPVPESYLVSEEKSGSPPMALTYTPFCLLS